MPDWKLWRDMANNTLLAAESLQPDKIRSAAIRYYYAAYQAGTAYILYRSQQPPLGREAWSHAETPELLLQVLGAAIRSENRKRDLVRKLRALYKKRCDADYISATPFSANNLSNVRRASRYFVKAIFALLPEDKYAGRS